MESKSGTGFTQFGRALYELGTELIFALSPQAKGRVEKSNRTLQDRLVKALRFHNISNIEDANVFLETFRTEYNQKFAKPPLEEDVHKPLTFQEKRQLQTTLSIQTPRTISKDMLIKHNSNIYRIIAPGQVNRLSQASVLVCQGVSSKITILFRNQPLQYEVYKKHLHVDQVLGRKGVNQYLNQQKNFDKLWTVSR